MSKFDQLKDGEGFSVEQGEKFALECGDCGCVRNVVVVVENDKLGIALEVDEAATAKRRKLPSRRVSIRRLADGI